MAENSKIEWCDHTFNPWEGCTKVSPGCANCYAEARNHRWGLDNWGKGKARRKTSAANWKLPVKWNMQAEAFNLAQEYLEKSRARAPRVFCASLADWLDDEVPIEWLADLLKLIHDTPNLDWLLLTKRPENWVSRILKARNFFTKGGCADTALWLNDWLPKAEMPGFPARDGKAPHNVWIGTTVENQEMADKRIPELLKIPAKVRFLSCEPLLGALRIKDALRCDVPIHWVICGGESGPKARPMHPDWARSLRDQCLAAQVPFFFKQWGEWAGSCYPEEGVIHVRKNGSSGDFPTEHSWSMKRVGKKAAGRLLDGREWNEFPKIN